MRTVTITVEANEIFDASPILADLRVVAETLFYPLCQVGFWDSWAAGAHLCPQESRKADCPHNLKQDNPSYVDYSQTAELEMGAILEVVFPHAQVHIYLK